MVGGGGSGVRNRHHQRRRQKHAAHANRATPAQHKQPYARDSLRQSALNTTTALVLPPLLPECSVGLRAGASTLAPQRHRTPLHGDDVRPQRSCTLSP